MDIKDRLKLLRLEKGYTQAEISYQLGLTKSAYGHYERGVNIPPREKLEEIAKLFGVSIEYLIGTTDYRTHAEEFNTIYDTKRLKNESNVLQAVHNLYGLDTCEVLIQLIQLNKSGITKAKEYIEDLDIKYYKGVKHE